MDLRNEKRISTPECFVCRWAGKHVILWPQEPASRPQEVQDELTTYTPQDRLMYTKSTQYTSGEWKVYIKVEEPIIMPITSNQLRSGHRPIEACGQHWLALEVNWVQVAWEEVALAYLWDTYIERTER